MNDNTNEADEQVITTRPTIRPQLVVLLLTFVVGGGIVTYLGANPRLLGDMTRFTARLVTLLVGLVAVGTLWKIWVLNRTEYRLTPDRIERRYQFFLRERHRQLPLERVRGYELDQHRLERLFGYGTVVFLSGGVNQSLGFLEFESVPNPDRVREYVDDRL